MILEGEKVQINAIYFTLENKVLVYGKISEKISTFADRE